MEKDQELVEDKVDALETISVLTPEEVEEEDREEDNANYLKKEVTMPYRDGTGPIGQGPLTGGGRGYCAGFANLERSRIHLGFRRGYGRGSGRGLGWGYGYRADFVQPPTMSKEQELELLKNQAASIQGTLQNIENRISELEKQK